MVPFRELYWNISRTGSSIRCFCRSRPSSSTAATGSSSWSGRVSADGGIPPPRADRLRALLDQALLQRRLLRQPVAGSVHLAISWGFALLFVATCLVAAQDYLGVPTLQGPVLPLLHVAGRGPVRPGRHRGGDVALVRRYVARPERLWKPRDQEGYGLFLWLLLVVLVSGFLVEGLRIAATADPWGLWSPGGWLAARPLPDCRRSSRPAGIGCSGGGTPSSPSDSSRRCRSR